MKRIIPIIIVCILAIALLNACEQQNPDQIASKKVPFSLISGTPPSPDPDPLVYTGNVDLKGWIVQVPFYTGQPEPHFHIAEESLSKLPQEIVDSGKRDFKLKDISSADMALLENYSEKVPAEITVSKLTLSMEGNPTMNFVGIVNQ